MKCLNCEATKFEQKQKRFSVPLKGEQINVIVPAQVCTKCDEAVMDSSQMNELRRATADEYRRKHGLLTSQEILAYRNKLNLNQVQFASYLHVGEASVKRWETYFIQDESQDEHIRLKCDEFQAELNALGIRWKTHQADEYSGGENFNWERFKELTC